MFVPILARQVLYQLKNVFSSVCLQFRLDLAVRHSNVSDGLLVAEGPLFILWR